MKPWRPPAAVFDHNWSKKLALATQIKAAEPNIDQICINSIRVVAIDAVQKANSGHPGMPMGMAPIAYLLWTRFMRYNPANPHWFGRARFERDDSGLFDHSIFGICSDGDLMEGVASEAASIAGHLGLGNIIYLYDDNHITIDGGTDLSFDEDVSWRFRAYGWHTQGVDDANDLDAVSRAIENAIAEKTRPSLIRVRSHIGFGSPNRQDTSKAHGQALGVEEVKLTKRFYGWPEEPAFYVPDEALKHFRDSGARGREYESEWNSRFERYAK